MRQQKLPQTDGHDCQTLRTKQNDHMELLAAASESEIMCAGWLHDQRINVEHLKS